MAGGKLSPRQKMINMMYLVLTALLALNISSEILQAFESLRESLKVSSKTYGEQNVNLLSNIRQTINDEIKQGNDRNVKFQPVLDKIEQEGNAMVAYLDSLEIKLETIGEADPETKEIKNKEERDANYRFWMGGNDTGNGGRGEGEAATLKDKLNGFVSWANTLVAKYDTSNSMKPFKPLAIDPDDLPDADISEEHKGKTWEYVTFHGKPVVADLAMMEKFKMDVKEAQNQLLQLVERAVGGVIFKIDKLRAMEAPFATVVPAGLKFQTRLMVGMYSDQVKPEFVGNGIKLDEGGNTATMTLTANGGVIPAGASEGIQRYRAMIKVPKAGGGYEELPIEGQFIVKRPEVVVRSEELQLLYKDCGNKVSVDVPALGDEYNPDFSRSKGGKVKKVSGSKKKIVIVPSQRNFLLSVYSRSGGQSVKIDELKYNVIAPPQPQLVLEVGGREHDGASSINRRQRVKVRLKPDKEFYRTLKKDARYKVGTVKLMYQSGIQAPRTLQSKSGNIMNGISFNLNQGALRQAPPGSKIFFEIEGVRRVNFEGRPININMSRRSRILAVNIR